MEQQLAQRLAGELGVHVTQVVREYWEVTFLDALLSGEHGKNLVFRGGTALRLAYGSPRWFICQMMKVPYAPPVAVMERKTLRRDLRKFLPRKYWPVIEELA